MIFNYSITKVGYYHLEKNIVCQDFHCLKQVDQHFAIASVADGLGSEIRSDIASKIASETSVMHCYKTITRGMKKEKIIEHIKDSFREALDSINKYVSQNNDDISQYDTTLSLVVYMDGNVYFGHSGDSGILVYLADGTYKVLSEKQNDENGYVYPLCYGEEKWQFGYEENVASVLLATDGIYDLLFPYLLANSQNKIYVCLAEYLMNNEKLKFNKLNYKKVQEKMASFIDNLKKEDVDDDKTILVLLDTSIKVKRQPDDYYAVPDWKKLKDEFDKKYFEEAYPNLVADKGEDNRNE